MKIFQAKNVENISYIPIPPVCQTLSINYYPELSQINAKIIDNGYIKFTAKRPLRQCPLLSLFTIFCSIHVHIVV